MANTWNNFTRSLRWHRDRDELTALIQWAQRKRLTQVRKFYEMRLQDVERRLAIQQMRYPDTAQKAKSMVSGREMVRSQKEPCPRIRSEISTTEILNIVC